MLVRLVPIEIEPADAADAADIVQALLMRIEAADGAAFVIRRAPGTSCFSARVDQQRGQRNGGAKNRKARRNVFDGHKFAHGISCCGPEQQAGRPNVPAACHHRAGGFPYRDPGTAFESPSSSIARRAGFEEA